jgi:hypothetical protein
MPLEEDSISAAEQKAIMKQAIQEWLDSRFAAVGRWSLGLVVAALLTAIARMVIHFSETGSVK